MIIICDIDGTIAEKGDRNIFDYSNVHLDKPINQVIDVIDLMLSDDYTDINTLIFVSGREDSCRDLTNKWLLDNFVFLCTRQYDLHMRKTCDYRDDTIIKREIFNEHILPIISSEYNLDLSSVIVFDDRPRVIRMWRELGLFVFNCAQHDREF